MIYVIIITKSNIMKVKVRYKKSDLIIVLPEGSTTYDLKNKLSEVVSLEISHQKIICKGKILQDTDIINKEIRSVILFEIRPPINLNERRPCLTNGCIFYGSYLTQWYCSQCYRESNEPDTSSSNTTTSSDDFIDGPPRPTQTNRERCFTCQKRVGLLGFKCRCEYVFCGKHRHFTDHDCLYDWKKSGQRDLKNNIHGLDLPKLEGI